MKTPYLNTGRAMAAGVCAAVLLAACGGGGGAPRSAADKGTGTGSTWAAGAPAEWNKILEAAKKEGEVVVAGPAFLAEPLAKAFKSDTGITLSYLGGDTRELNSRLDQEAQAGNVTIDVSLGGGTQLNTLLPAGLLKPIRPQLILPSAADGKNWKAGDQKYLDNQGKYMLQTTQWVHGWIAVNPDALGDVKVETWDDLLQPKLVGRITAYDPRTGGQGQSAAAYLAEVKGMDYIVRLFKGQKVVYTQDGGQLMEGVARGTYAVALGGIAPDVERYRKEGLPIEVRAMKDGPGALTGGFSVLKQPVGGPHPSAAQVFLNWFASGRGLDVYAKVLLEPSLRVDSKSQAPDYLIPKNGVKYIDQYTEDWYTTVRPQVSEKLAKVLGS